MEHLLQGLCGADPLTRLTRYQCISSASQLLHTKRSQVLIVCKLCREITVVLNVMWFCGGVYALRTKQCIWWTDGTT